jgi:hypothetical protein
MLQQGSRLCQGGERCDHQRSRIFPACCCAPNDTCVGPVLQGQLRVLREHPYIWVVGLLVAAILIAAGTFGVLAATSTETSHRRTSAQGAAAAVFPRIGQRCLVQPCRWPQVAAVNCSYSPAKGWCQALVSCSAISAADHKVWDQHVAADQLDDSTVPVANMRVASALSAFCPAGFVDNAAVAFEGQVAQTFAPLLALVIFIHDNPYYPALARRFDRLAQELLSQVGAGHCAAPDAPAGCMCISFCSSSCSGQWLSKSLTVPHSTAQAVALMHTISVQSSDASILPASCAAAYPRECRQLAADPAGHRHEHVSSGGQ